MFNLLNALALWDTRYMDLALNHLRSVAPQHPAPSASAGFVLAPTRSRRPVRSLYLRRGV